MSNLKKFFAGLALATALTGAGFGATAAPASAAPVTITQPPTSGTVQPHIISGVRLSVVSDKWGLYHGKATNVRTGGTEYYGPARWFKSDAWKDVQGWAD